MTIRLLVWAGVKVVFGIVQSSLLRLGVQLQILELDVAALGLCDVDHLLADLLLEETQNSLWCHHSLVVFGILELTEGFVIKDERHDPFGHGSNILILARLADVHLRLEYPLDTDSLIEHNVEVRDLKLELSGPLPVLRSSGGDLVEQLLHKTANYHALLLRKTILRCLFGVGIGCGEIAEGVDHVHQSHHLNQNLIVDLIGFFANGITFSGIELPLVLGINYREIGRFEKSRHFTLL